MIKKAPWTEEEVIELNNYQQKGSMHPYTCDRNHLECEVHTKGSNHNKDGVLIATRNGWICPCGKYKQDWY